MGPCPPGHGKIDSVVLSSQVDKVIEAAQCTLEGCENEAAPGEQAQNNTHSERLKAIDKFNEDIDTVTGLMQQIDNKFGMHEQEENRCEPGDGPNAYFALISQGSNQEWHASMAHYQPTRRVCKFGANCYDTQRAKLKDAANTRLIRAKAFARPIWATEICPDRRRMWEDLTGTTRR
jgi:hypothetical protein